MSNEVESTVTAELAKLLSEDLDYNNAANRFRGILEVLSRKQKRTPLDVVDQTILYLSQPNARTYECELDFLNAYRISLISRRRKGTLLQLTEASGGKVKLDTTMLNDVALMQNRARGKTFEQMGAVLVEYYLREIEHYSGPITVSADRSVFESLNSKGMYAKRRFDLYLEELGIGVEIKSGRITYQNSIKDQIFKDHYLLTNKIVNNVWWFLFYGASQRVLTELLVKKINFIDLGFNDFEDV
jgi:hypothetical protein